MHAAVLPGRAEDAGQNIYQLYRRDTEAAEQRRQPQPAQTVWQPGSMQWLAEQNKPK
jgi:hypothetical protein